jgi:hypothetical protein
MRLKKILIFSIVTTLCFLTLNVPAQKKSNKNPSVKSLKAKQKKQPKTISGGVVNGKAIDLVVPIYPQAALITGTYGQIVVKVLIDIDGKVLTADVITGNPLLRNSCAVAAKQSKFSPVQISGEFVRIHGFILYNFLPANWNWLEIGFILESPFSTYYSSENLANYFPPGFDEEIQLLNQKTNTGDRNFTFVIASIKSKLNDNPKSFWLFSLGLTLGKIKNSCCRSDDEMKTFSQDLRNFIQTKPENISPILISNLEKFILYAENPTLDNYNPNEGSKIRVTSRELEENFSTFGK